VTDSLMESAPLPLAWWSVASSLAVGAWACLTILFCVGVIAWRQPPRTLALRRCLLALVLAGALAAIAGWVYGVPWVLTGWYATLALTSLLFAGYLLWHAMGRQAPQHSRILAAAILANVAVGLLDLYRLRIEPSTVGSTGLYFSSVLFGLVTGVIVLTRFRAASGKVVELNASLERRVAQKEAELARSYQRLEQTAREQARSSERSRILRDMHDGVGSHISTAIRQLLTGRASDAEVLQTLRESLDELKLSVDSMDLPPGDITALLANLRYRLEPRLQACGIELVWAVDALEPMAGLDAGAMRQLQFMLFEAISNVMQHAQASQLRIEAQQTAQGACIGVVDNGGGFDVGQTPRRGLRQMQERAQAIGVQLQIYSQPGYTSLQMVLSAEVHHRLP
jgi:signal transduction histidine kinase